MVFSFLLIIDFYFSIFPVIAQLFIASAKLVIPTKISTKEAKTKIEIHSVTAETKISKCST